MNDRRKSLFDALVGLAIVGLSLYPVYKDDLARWRLWIDQRLEAMFARGDGDALVQVQREISMMEHGTGPA